MSRARWRIQLAQKFFTLVVNIVKFFSMINRVVDKGKIVVNLLS